MQPDPSNPPSSLSSSVPPSSPVPPEPSPPNTASPASPAWATAGPTLPPELPRFSDPISPLSPQGLFQLFVRPRVFFSSLERLAGAPGLVFLAFLYGVYAAMDKIDQEIVKSLVATRPRPLDGLIQKALHSWADYWTVALAGGLISALISWVVVAWFYRKRLEWSGAVQPDADRARQVWLYQSAVETIPAVVIAILHTVAFPNYLEAWASDDVTNWIVLFLLFWSCWVSYVGATTAFTLKRRAALFWFLALPVGVRAVAVGLVAFALNR